MTTKSDILYVIRAKCLDCCGYQRSEVRLCVATDCPLHLYRFGKDPKPSETRGFAKPPDYTGDYGQEKDPPPRQKKTPACAPTQNRGEDETHVTAKSNEVSHD